MSVPKSRTQKWPFSAAPPSLREQPFSRARRAYVLVSSPSRCSWHLSTARPQFINEARRRGAAAYGDASWPFQRLSSLKVIRAGDAGTLSRVGSRPTSSRSYRNLQLTQAESHGSIVFSSHHPHSSGLVVVSVVPSDRARRETPISALGPGLVIPNSL